ncbi:hypothetical protein PFISCL1PPCAC_9187, partial [Pristionchus fissidentatus]
IAETHASLMYLVYPAIFYLQLILWPIYFLINKRGPGKYERFQAEMIIAEDLTRGITHPKMIIQKGLREELLAIWGRDVPFSELNI